MACSGQTPRIKLIMTDIDNTIMPAGSTRSLRERWRRFHAAFDAGIVIGPASGRGRVQVAPFFRGDEACFATAVATNGLEVYCQGEKIGEYRLPVAYLEQTLEVVRSIPGAGLLWFDGTQPYLVAATATCWRASFPPMPALASLPTSCRRSPS